MSIKPIRLLFVITASMVATPYIVFSSSELDPGSQFSLQLIQQLGGQIGQGYQQAQDRNIKGRIVSRFSQAQSEDEILEMLLDLQADLGLSEDAVQAGITSAQIRLKQIQRRNYTYKIEMLRDYTPEQHSEYIDCIERSFLPIEEKIEIIKNFESRFKKNR